MLGSQQCDLFANFNDHRIIFDLTFCGKYLDWPAFVMNLIFYLSIGDGQPNAYAAVGCSDAICTENLKDPANFDVSYSSFTSDLSLLYSHYRFRMLLGVLIQ